MQNYLKNRTMDELKKYICEHRDEFDSVPLSSPSPLSPSLLSPSLSSPSLPSGSKERFMANVRRRMLRRVFYVCASSVAAVLTVVAVLKYETDESLNVARMVQKMADCEVEIMSMVELHNPYDVEVASSTIRSITDEAIPLAALLPEELPSKERMRILKEYYGQKIEALERVRLAYLEVNDL